MHYRLSSLPELEIGKGFVSERDWLAHLGVLADLPYPSLSLMPSILSIIRKGVAGEICGFGWANGAMHPVAFMTENMNLRAYHWWNHNAGEFFALCPVQEQWDSQGESFRQVVTAPEFTRTGMFREVYGSLGVRWATLAPVQLADGQGYGFLSIYRAEAAGPYTAEEHACLQRGTRALASLDRQDNPWHRLAPAETALASAASLIVRPDGSLSARSREAARLLYLQGGATMSVLEWVRMDWLALPPQVREMAQWMFAQPESEISRRVGLQQPWGRFEFVLEKVLEHRASAAAEALIIVNIHYFEAIDITVARRLAGWPLSPREKRIVIAGARCTDLAELADALQITLLTLKTYNRELVGRLQVGSRQRLIELLLSDEAARHDPVFASAPWAATEASRSLPS
ncbi:MAG: hypothetical protein LBE61_09030 [Burkholderiaceae bacterium]|jgi:DNA-binding CsgD family transcriptional regulator|nr:hypothetical protein [Burkholderiaceae bacterium]